MFKIFKFMHNKKGFTLIELMIVVAIIGILAAIAIPNFLRFQAKSKQAEAKTNLGAIGTTAEAYRAEKDTYETDWTGLGWQAQGTTRYDYGYNGNLLDLAQVPAVTYAPQNTATDAATTSTAFLAAAEGDVDAETTGKDCWTYNEQRALNNTNNDVAVDTGGC